MSYFYSDTADACAAARQQFATRHPPYFSSHPPYLSHNPPVQAARRTTVTQVTMPNSRGKSGSGQGATMGDRTAGTDAQATAGSWGGGRTVYSARSAVKPRNRDETYIPQQGNRPTFDGSDTADEGIVSDDLHDILLAKHDAEVRKQKLLQVQGVEESAEWDYMFQQIIDANQCADP